MTYDLYYVLYRLDTETGDYEHVDDPNDVDLESKLIGLDVTKKVESTPADLRDTVDDHVVDTFTDETVADYIVELPSFKDSRYDGSGWSPVYLGASLIYRVYKPGHFSEDLCLAVSTQPPE